MKFKAQRSMVSLGWHTRGRASCASTSQWHWTCASKEVPPRNQWQVVCGGLVYVAMFRRPLLGGLNKVWQHIESYG